ncbi:MAG: Asp-tRNA(Asn)/Glu-tRNA(Gln) amidotransferase subunit GatA [bacterium]
MLLSELTISQVHEGLKKKEFSALEICRAHFDKIKEKDKKISAFLTLSENSALSQAKEVDNLISGGKEIPVLAGIPFAVKDNILVEEIKCTAGSKILENYLAPYNATVIERLKNQGAVVLGKTNLDEFGMGSSTENSAFGPTRNPHDLTRVPGGSSGGSAAAVAADMAVFSLGSDTGGSIRQPASFCGVVGLKPTYGAVSRSGLIAFASSLDQIGPITKTVEDARVVFEAISGKDPLDSTSVEMPRIQNTKYLPRRQAGKIQNTKIGAPREYFIKGIDPEVEKVIREAIKKYEDMGAKIVEVSLPHAEYALPAYYIINPSEASANLARYDGIKYGHSTKRAGNLMEVYLKSKEEGFGPEVRRRIILGTYVLSAGYYDAYYLRAQKVRTLVKNDFEKAFQKVDAIFTPTSPFLPFKIGERVKDPLSMYLVDVYTVSVNLAGLPALSLPVGKANNLPVGLQIIGKPFEEEKILEIGKCFN